MIDVEPFPSVLIIDDDVTFCGVLARALRRRGFEARVARNTEEALRLSLHESPEFVVLDLKLGAESGLSLVAALRAIDAAPRIVVLTGYASIATAIEAIKRGATHYLAKPADVDALIASFLRDAGDTTLPIFEERPTVEKMEWEYIQQVFVEHDGNVSKTARALKMHRRTLQRKLGKSPR